MGLLSRVCTLPQRLILAAARSSHVYLVVWRLLGRAIHRCLPWLIPSFRIYSFSSVSSCLAHTFGYTSLVCSWYTVTFYRCYCIQSQLKCATLESTVYCIGIKKPWSKIFLMRKFQVVKKYLTKCVFCTYLSINHLVFLQFLNSTDFIFLHYK